MKCLIIGCKNEVEIGKEYCSKECRYISVHSYVGESLRQYNKRRNYWLKYKKLKGGNYLHKINNKVLYK